MLRIAVRESTRPSPNLSLWLDAFRGLAAVAVVLGHAHALLLAGAAPGSGMALRAVTALIYFFSAWAHQAVIVFFVMSGYLVGGPFLLKSLNGTASASDYAAARLSRLYTVLIPALILTLLLDYISLRHFNGQAFVNARGTFFPYRPHLLGQLRPAVFVCNALFLQGIACGQYGSNLSLWSLSSEAFYYALWLALMMSPKRIAFRFAVPALIALVFYPYFIPGSAPRAIYYGVYFLVWAGGAFASSYRLFGKWTAVLAFIVSMPVWAIAAKLTGQDLGSDLLLAFAFIALIAALDGWNIGFPFARRSVRALAGISYSLYAIHLPILVFVLAWLGFSHLQPAVWSSLGLFTALIIFGIACAAAFWWLFERHTSQVKKRLLRLIPAKTALPVFAED